MLLVDGMVLNNDGYVDESNLTGESLPRLVKVDDELFSGVINMGVVLEIEVLKDKWIETI